MHENFNYLSHISKRKHIRISAFLLMMASFIPQFRAQTILTESFNYPATTQLTTANWTQLGAAAAPNISVSAGNLSYAGTQGNTIGNKVPLANTGQDVYRAFTAATLNATTPAIYTTAVVNVSAAQAIGDYFLSLGTTTTSISRVYIQSNGTGFSFGVLRNTGTVTYESTVRPFNTNIKLVLKYEQVAGATNDVVKLYVNPSSASEPGSATVSNIGTAADTTSFAAVQLYQGAATNAPTLEVDNIVVSTTWAGLTGPLYDYGDTPVSYDNTKDGVFAPAAHSFLSGLRLGATAPDQEFIPASVAAGADNNGTNGDGTDEDAIIASNNPIKKGVIYTLSVPVNNPAAATRYLYGWIDFNNDGRFQVGELADVVVTFSTNGTSTQTLTWSAAKTATLVSGVTNLYMRIRLSTSSLIDATDATIDERSVGNGAIAAANALDAAVTSAGEVEDYQIPISTAFDYGDVPASFENDKDGNALPALHLPLTGLRIGNLIDMEAAPSSVASGADNNGNNGDGADEDGISTVANITKGLAYSVTIPINNPATATRYLYGWIDFNNDGRFQSAELANAVVSFTTNGASTQTLTWSAAKTSTMATGAAKLYMRIRLSATALNDFTTPGSGGDTIDERSVGNGATSATVATNVATVAFGEVEDYQLTVTNTFEYGDTPASFENDFNGNPLPAMHAILPGFTIGKLIDAENAPASVTSPAQNNTTGDNLVGTADEDGISTFTSVNRGVAYSIQVPVNAPSTLTGTKYLYGWLDFNGDGRFQSNEFTQVTHTTTGEDYLTLTWTAAQTTTITAGTSRIYLRLRYSNLLLTDFSSGTGSGVIDERSVGNGATSGTSGVNNINLAYGETEDYQLSVDSYDFGDVPVSYDTNNASSFQPARQISSTGYTIGIASDFEPAALNVASGADNNGTNGDGLDEDGLSGVLPVITKGTAFNFSVPVNTITASDIIAWIDFNNNGKFELSEAAYTASTGSTTGYQATPIGTSNITFWFRGSQTALIPAGVNNLYARIRLATATGADAAATTGIDERSIADGANTGIYTTPLFGEVEDYRFSVGTDVYDFGDAPASYEMDKDGTANPTNYKPARNNPTDALYLGSIFDKEAGPNSVASGADNNGTNGDGADEEGLASGQLFIQSGVANTFTVALNNSTGNAATLYGWIDTNNNGRFESTEASTAVAVASGDTSATITFTAANISAIAATTNKVYMRLRLIQADPGVTIADYTTTPASTNYLVVDERAIADGLSTGAYGTVSSGEVEDYQLTIIRDFGDVPASYENGNPASQSNTTVPEVSLGATIDYELINNPVASGADNNGTNGDGADEDGVTTPQTITSGTPFILKIPVNSTVGGTKNLYGWIDFNGDGIFNGNEVATTTVSVTAGTTATATLTWTNTTAGATVLLTGKTYARLRLSTAALAANGNNATPALIDTRSYGQGTSTGEIEDYQFNVTNQHDYGDAPISYDMNKDGTVNPLNFLPARQAMSPLLTLGTTVDIESGAQSVAAGANNNGTNGDGNDEDGTTAMPINRGTTYYSKVSVMNNTGATKNLYGWIDFNNNGRFESTELSTITIPTSATQQTVSLSWNSTNTASISAGVNNVYMRLRLSQGLADLTSGLNNGVVDERAIGDGISGNAGSTPYDTEAQIGEIEDYMLPVTTTYDYGDLPDTYDNNASNVLVSARQTISSALFIGNNPADAETSKLVSSDALGDDNNGIDDEDGVILSPIFTGGGAGYTARVRVSNFTATAKTLYGWIDFDNDGIFQQDEEVASASIAAGTDNAWTTLTWATGTASTILGNPSNLSIRLRLSEAALANLGAATTVAERALGDGLNTGILAAAASNGEIEDHKIQVTNQLDFGDVPVYFEENFLSAIVPARHLPNGDLRIGTTTDVESSAQSVAAGADNNGSNGDGLDEDGVTTPLPSLTSGQGYSAPVNVTNNLATTATLHAWIDFNGNGRFTANEYTSVTLAASSGTQTVTLNWPLVTYTGTASNTYMRVRLSSATFTDNTSTDIIDERSIADGLTTGAYGTYPINGEVEDYFVPINMSSVGGTPQSCNDVGTLGQVNPVQTSWHTSIIKTASNDWLVFGVNAAPNGASSQGTPLILSPANGFNFTGNALMVTVSSQQYFVLSTTGLYAWGSGGLFSTPNAFTQVPLPAGVNPNDVQMIDGGANNASLALLTKTGEVWIQSLTIGHNIQGDGGVMSPDWHRVMINATTPLTGMKDVRTGGLSAIATDGNTFYTWGTNVYLGNGSANTNRNYATQMSTPAGITLPVKQIDLSNSAGSSFYMLDTAGKVFVLGNNNNGQLGLGNTANVVTWVPITSVNEEPEATGNQTDISKPIGKVRWISASNHESNGNPVLGLVTEDGRAYSAAVSVYISGDKTGVQGATNRAFPTALTINSGQQMLQGNVLFIEQGGHISVLVMKGSDRYAYAGHTADGSDGCNSCTADPVEFRFNGPPSIGPICGNTAFDYGDLDDNYNLGDKASHEIKFSQAANPLKLGAVAADSNEGPQFTVTGSGNDALGDDNDVFGDDEDAFTGTMPVKTSGSPYTLNVPLTNNTGSTAYLHGFIDWNNNGSFEANEAVSQTVPPSATAQTVALTWPADSGNTGCSSSIRSFIRLRLTTSALIDNVSTTVDERSHIAAADGEVEDYYVDWTPICGDSLDSDGDGIADLIDLDDDNDGILDSNECEYNVEHIVNGTFTGNANGWDLGNWQYLNNEVNNQNQTVSNEILSQTFATNLSSQVYRLSFKLGSTELNNSSTTNTATLEIKVGGITYAKFTNGTGRSNNVTVFMNNGATTNFVPFTSVNSRTDTDVIMYIPYNAANASNNEIQFIFGADGDDWYLDNVSLMGGCDTDGDGIPDKLDLDSDNDGCIDAIEGSENVTTAQLVNAGGTVTVGTGSSAANQNLCANGTCIDAQGVPTVVNVGGAADTGNNQGQGVGTSNDSLVNTCITSCYKPAAVAGTALETKHGITALNRAGADNSNWPMVRSGAWTVLESKEKGFVVNRVATTAALSLITNPIEGMMVYDQQAACLKIYTIKEGETTANWHCLTTQACPD